MHLAENMEKTKGKQEFPKLTLLMQKIGHVTTVQLLFRMICIIYLLLFPNTSISNNASDNYLTNVYFPRIILLICSKGCSWKVSIWLICLESDGIELICQTNISQS